LELTQSGGVISYEEYHPFGSTAFHTAQGSLGVSTKRYRYTGKERDEETGLYYHGARYYAPWLGRWTAADPLGLTEPGRADLNLYAYVRGNPISRIDPQGLADTEPVGVPFGPNGANPGTLFVFGEGKDRLVNGDAFKQVSEGKQLFRYDPKASLPGGLADRLSPEQFSQAVKNILGGALVESGAQSDAGTQAPGEGGAVEESFGTQAAQLAGRLSGESGEAGGSEFGVPGGGAAVGGALDNEAGQVLAAGAVITDAVSSIVNLGKLAVKLGTVIAKKAVDIAARSVSKSVAKEVAKDLEAVAAGGGKAFTGSAYELKHVPKHLEGTTQANRLIRREGAAHVFTDRATLAAAENAIFEGGQFTGVVRGTQRFGLMFKNPIGARIAADGSRIPLFYGEAKVGADGLYHIFPRTGPSVP
jgi:RHS repeat-associated protein